MMVFDSKTPGIQQNGERYILPTFPASDNATFKASYIVTDDLTCSGKVTALFDLIVIGDVDAHELEVKGRFICTGKCRIDGELVVQNDIWVNDLFADAIDAHDHIIAQQIDARIIKTDSNIIVGKTLAVEDAVNCDANVICGETAYGSGKIAAKMVITGEPLDLDNGEAALVSPNKYDPSAHTVSIPSSLADEIFNLSDVKSFRDKLDCFAKKNDYTNYLDLLVFIVPDTSAKERFCLWKNAIGCAIAAASNKFTDFTNINVLIWLTDAVFSGYFSGWDTITNVYTKLKRYFERIVRCENPSDAEPLVAKRLAINDIVIHDTLGRGIVQSENTELKISEVLFDSGHVGSFLVPSALSHFKFVGVYNNNNAKQLRDRIECSLEGYGDWLCALDVLRRHCDQFDTETYTLAFELVFSNLGLKAKFVEDRLNDKEWNFNGQQP